MDVGVTLTIHDHHYPRAKVDSELLMFDSAQVYEIDPMVPQSQIDLAYRTRESEKVQSLPSFYFVLTRGQAQHHRRETRFPTRNQNSLLLLPYPPLCQWELFPEIPF